MDSINKQPKTAKEISIELNKPLKNIISYISTLKKQKKIFKIEGTKPYIYTTIQPKELPKIIREVDFLTLEISQDDLWLLYRQKFGKGTRIKRSELLPKFAEVFKRELRNL